MWFSAIAEPTTPQSMTDTPLPTAPAHTSGRQRDRSRSNSRVRSRARRPGLAHGDGQTGCLAWMCNDEWRCSNPFRIWRSRVNSPGRLEGIALAEIPVHTFNGKSL